MEEVDSKKRFRNKMRLTIKGSTALCEISYIKKVRTEFSIHWVSASENGMPTPVLVVQMACFHNNTQRRDKWQSIDCVEFGCLHVFYDRQ